MAMNNFNNNFNPVNSNSSSSSATVSNSKSAAPVAHSSESSSNNVSHTTSAKVTPKIFKPLDERTSVNDVNNKVRNLKITEKDGTVVTASLMAPSYKQAVAIDDSRQAFNMMNREMTLTTVRFDQKLFKIVRNLEVNHRPVGRLTWSFADKHLEAFNWIVDKANSFLANKFTTN